MPAPETDDIQAMWKMTAPRAVPDDPWIIPVDKLSLQGFGNAIADELAARTPGYAEDDFWTNPDVLKEAGIGVAPDTDEPKFGM